MSMSARIVSNCCASILIYELTNCMDRINGAKPWDSYWQGPDKDSYWQVLEMKTPTNKAWRGTLLLTRLRERRTIKQLIIHCTIGIFTMRALVKGSYHATIYYALTNVFIYICDYIDISMENIKSTMSDSYELLNVMLC